MAPTDTVETRLGRIEDTLNNHVLSTLEAHGERLDDIEVRLGGLEEEVRHVKDGVDAIRDHLGA